MTGGNLLSRFGVVNIFNTVSAKTESPICLSFIGKFGAYLLIQALRLAELALHSQSVRTVEQVDFFLIVCRRNRLPCAAGFTFYYLDTVGHIQIITAAFASENRHIISSQIIF